MEEFNSLIDVLNAACKSGRGITYVISNTEQKFISYLDLYHHSLSLLANLRARGVEQGSEVIILISDNELFLTAFWACILGRMTAIPLASGSQEIHKIKFSNIYDQLDKPYVISDVNFRKEYLSYLEKNNLDVYLLNAPEHFLIDDLLDGVSSAVLLPQVALTDLAYIQYSSGSTGTPKGVILTHANLISNTLAIAERVSITADDKGLAWLPLTHDMGMICFHLTCMIRSCSQVVLSTALFIKRPLLWLEMTSRYRATLLYSPNFGFQYIMSAIAANQSALSWDLSSIKAIINGAEPISRDICIAFLNKLSVYQLSPNCMYPGYGLAEGSVAVTLPDKFQKLTFLSCERKFLAIGDQVKLLPGYHVPDAISFAVVGYPVNDCQIRLTDDDNHILQENFIGNIEIRGLNVTSGYYKDPVHSAGIFTIDGWLKTGDIGFSHQGQLVITGRKKDIIIVNGQNFYPHDLEQFSERKLGLKPGSVVACSAGHENGVVPQVLLFVQYKGKIDDFHKISEYLRENISLTIGLEVDFVIPVKSIPKTTSGKVMHFNLAEKFLNGDFNELLRQIDDIRPVLPLTNDGGNSLLKLQLEEISNKIFYNHALSWDSDFFESGLNSLKALSFLNLLNKLGYKLSFNELFEHSSFNNLYQYLLQTKNAPGIELYPLSYAQDDLFPLSWGQKQLLLVHLLQTTTTNLNISVLTDISHFVDVSSFILAVEALIDRHESLRTVFTWMDGEPQQRVLTREDLGFRVTVKNFIQEADPGKAVQQYADEMAGITFDLTRGPLIHVMIARKDTASYSFLLVMHHIICDGWSIDVLSKELSMLYGVFSRQNLNLLPEAKFQYRDFVHWQQLNFNSPSYLKSRSYWLNQLSGDLPNTLIPSLKADYGTPLTSSNGAVYHFDLTETLTCDLKSASWKNGVTIFSTLIAVLSILLYQYNDEEDIIIGTDSAGRNHHELENQVGYYLNILAIRLRFRKEDKFSDLQSYVHKILFDAYDHQDYPFDHVLENLDIVRYPGHNPLFNILVLYQNFENTLGFGQLIDDAVIHSKEIDNGTSLNDLLIEFSERDKQLHVKFRYNTDLFEPFQIAALALQFETLAHSVLQFEQRQIRDFDILTTDQRVQLLDVFNATATDFGLISWDLVSCFEQSAAMYPQSVAIVYKDIALSYEELNSRSNRIADYLRKDYGVHSGTLVGLKVSRGLDLIICMLGILKAGGAYVPIDPEYPSARIDYMIAESGLQVVLTDDTLWRHSSAAVKIGDHGLFDNYSGDNHELVPAKEDLAYVMYTSGSTGRPKGVMISHESVVNYSCAFSTFFKLTAADKVIQQSSIAFDTAVEEIFPVLCCGGTLVMAPDGGRDIVSLLDTIEKNQATVLSTTPMVLQEINSFSSRLQSLRIAISGGDELKHHFIDHILEVTTVYNSYGPTETTVCATYAKVERGISPIKIGSPVANTKVYVVNHALGLRPMGVPGELCISGKGVALGYLHHPELTASRFVANPYGTGLLYRTGDLVSWTISGELEFHGRIDSQVKIRGYRIEPGEIEQVMQKHPDVVQAVVVSISRGEDKVLSACYTSTTGLEVSDLRLFVQQLLPQYMIPSHFTWLEKLPLTPNGKIDRKNLPDPVETEREYHAPEGEIEQRLAVIWEQVLGYQPIGRNDNFFEIGGHSLKAIQVISRIFKELAVKLELQDLFSHPSLSELSEEIEVLMWVSSPSLGNTGNNTDEIIL